MARVFLTEFVLIDWGNSIKMPVWSTPAKYLIWKHLGNKKTDFGQSKKKGKKNERIRCVDVFVCGSKWISADPFDAQNWFS